MKIMLVEDHPEQALLPASCLGQKHYRCEVAGTFVVAREKLALFTYDCVVLAVVLPDGNGPHQGHYAAAQPA